MSDKDLKKSLPDEEAATRPEKKSLSSSDSEKSEASVNLNESTNRHMFLTKIGITFMLYSLAGFCTSIFILIDIKRTTIVYRQWSLQTVLWVFLTVSLLIKVVYGFFGAPIRKLAKLVFPIDVFATVIFILGLYYYLDSYKTTTNYSYAPFVVIVCVNFFVSSFFFTLTTLYHSRSKEYNYLIGTAMMTIFNVVAIIALAYGWNQVVTITPAQYTWVGVGFLVFNLYICVNSYYIINVRLDKYTESDAVWAFYSYWTDWVFAFWKNVFENTTRIIQQKRRQLKKAQKAREEKEKKEKAKKAAEKLAKAAKKKAGDKKPKDEAEGEDVETPRAAEGPKATQPQETEEAKPRKSEAPKKPAGKRAAEKVEVKIA